MNEPMDGRSWHPGAEIAIGHDLTNEHVLLGIRGEAGSLIRLSPDQAMAMARALRATARRVGRSQRSAEVA